MADEIPPAAPDPNLSKKATVRITLPPKPAAGSSTEAKKETIRITLPQPPAASKRETVRIGEAKKETIRITLPSQSGQPLSKRDTIRIDPVGEAAESQDEASRTTMRINLPENEESRSTIRINIPEEPVAPAGIKPPKKGSAQLAAGAAASGPEAPSAPSIPPPAPHGLGGSKPFIPPPPAAKGPLPPPPGAAKLPVPPKPPGLAGLKPPTPLGQAPAASGTPAAPLKPAMPAIPGKPATAPVPLPVTPVPAPSAPPLSAERSGPAILKPAAPKKETTRIQLPPDAKTMPKATVKLQQTAPMIPAPAPAIKTAADIAENETQAGDGLVVPLSLGAAAAALLAALAAILTYLGT